MPRHRCLIIICAERDASKGGRCLSVCLQTARNQSVRLQTAIVRDTSCALGRTERGLVRGLQKRGPPGAVASRPRLRLSINAAFFVTKEDHDDVLVYPTLTPREHDSICRNHGLTTT